MERVLPFRFKAAAPRVTYKLMQSGGPWDAQLQALCRNQLRLVARDWLHLCLKIPLNKAEELSDLLFHVERFQELCVPLIHTHGTTAEDYADGSITLAEAFGMLANGTSKYKSWEVAIPLDDASVVEYRPRRWPVFRQSKSGETSMVSSDLEDWYYAIRYMRNAIMIEMFRDAAKTK
jgi:hypothetical protein